MPRPFLKCPKCSGKIAIDPTSSASKVECPECGAKFSFKPKTTSAPGPTEGDEVYGLAAIPEPPPKPRVREANDDTVNPPQPKPRTISKKPGASAKSRRLETTNPAIGRKVIGGALAAIVGLGLVAIIAWTVLPHGGRPAGAPVAAVEAPPALGEYVTIGTPTPGVGLDPNRRIELPLFAAIPVNEIKAPNPRPKIPRQVIPSALTPPQAQDTRDRWSIAVDPPSKEGAQPKRFADRLSIPVGEASLKYSSMLIGPVLADRSRLYAIIPPTWPEPVYGFGSKEVNGETKPIIDEKTQPPLPLIDLRSGEKVGEFSWKSPFWLAPRLSPNGKYLVGPDARPTWLDERKSFFDNKNHEDESLFVWARDNDAPERSFRLRGTVQWLEFIDDERLAIYLTTDKASVQIWDVSKGTMTAEIALTLKPFDRPAFDPQAPNPFLYLPLPTLGAISPGGRYLALGGPKGIAMVSVDDRKEIGTLPLTISSFEDQREYIGIGFSHDGATLRATTFDINKGSKISGWSVDHGASLGEFNVPLAMNGQVQPGTDPDTIVAYGYPVAEEVSILKPGLQRNAKLVEDGTARFLTDGPAIIDMPESGPALMIGALPGQPDDGKVGVYTSEAIRDIFHKAANLTDFGLPKRPKVQLIDRASGRLTNAEPPAAWTAAPTVETAVPPSDPIVLPVWPTTFGDGEGALIRVEPTSSKGRHGVEFAIDELIWERLDTRTGQRIGKPLTLWPWARNPLTKNGLNPPTIAALSPDGSLLALRDPDALDRVDVWKSTGERQMGFVPSIENADIDWLGWNAEGMLLTVADGSLSAWDVASAKLVFAVKGDYLDPLAIAPGRRWLAASTAKGHVNLLDMKDGRCLSRCQAGASGPLVDLLVSPDGARLAAIYATERELTDRFGDQQVNLVVWNLKTGKSEATRRMIRSYNLLHWGSPEHITLFDLEGLTFDMRGNAHVATAKFPKGHNWPKVGLPVQRSPDDRLWTGEDNGNSTRWMPVAVPDPKGSEEASLFAADRQYFDPNTSTLVLEIDVGPAKQGLEHGRNVVTQLQKCGYKIGPGGWKIRVSHAAVDSGATLSQGTTPIALPKVVYQWELVDTQGKVAWTAKTEGYFLGRSSRYYAPPKLGDPTVAPEQFDIRMEYYQFGNRDVKSAVVEEILERGAGLNFPDSIPRTILKSGDGYPKIPIGSELRFPKSS